LSKKKEIKLSSDRCKIIFVVRKNINYPCLLHEFTVAILMQGSDLDATGESSDNVFSAAEKKTKY